MIITALNDGSVLGTGTVTVDSGILGGVLITTDGTNAVTVILKRDDNDGKVIFQLVTDSTQFIKAPISLEDTTQLYYDVAGTGAAAQLFQWVE